MSITCFGHRITSVDSTEWFQITIIIKHFYCGRDVMLCIDALDTMFQEKGGKPKWVHRQERASGSQLTHVTIPAPFCFSHADPCDVEPFAAALMSGFCFQISTCLKLWFIAWGKAENLAYHRGLPVFHGEKHRSDSLWLGHKNFIINFRTGKT